jgi:putative transposase
VGSPVRTTFIDKAAPCSLDHVNRQFHAPAPKRLRVSDFTYASTWAGFVYVAFVIDVFSRYIVGWRVSRTAHTSFVLDALELASHDRRPVHGDSCDNALAENKVEASTDADRGDHLKP